MTDALTDAKALAAKLRAIHEAQPSFQAWQSAERLVQQLGGQTFADIMGAANERANQGRERVRHRSRLTQTDAAETALREGEIPLTTPKLLDAIHKLGTLVGGVDPLVNLSSALSKDDRFDSIRWRGERAWWFRDVPPPHDDLAELLGDTSGVDSFGVAEQ